MEGAENTQGGNSSSADRMVGMEHSEVRYFTRYESKASHLCRACMLIKYIATITTVINHLIPNLCYVMSLGVAWLTNNFQPCAGIHEEMLVSTIRRNPACLSSQFDNSMI